MAKQIITLEISFDMERLKSSGGYPLPAWLPAQIAKVCSWISGVTVLNISPVHWEADEDPEEYRQFMVDKGDTKWLSS